MIRSLAIRGLEALTRVRGGRRLLVLIYHRVLPAPDPMYPYDPDAASFKQQMQALAADFTALPLAEAVRRLQTGDLPERAVAVTFDDGFADNCTEALPILRENRVPATFFIASGYLAGSAGTGGCMFNDCIIEACRGAPAGTWATGIAELGTVTVGPIDDKQARRALAYDLIGKLKYAEPARRLERAQQLLEAARVAAPTHLMMTEEQVRKLHAAGMTIGGHTRHHPILARLDDSQAEREIAGNRADLAAMVGEPTELFAYPNGQPGRDYGARDIALVRRLGYRAAVSTAWGFADARSDAYQVPRVGSWGASSWRYSGRLALARAGSRGGGLEAPLAHAGADAR